jgi:hypothetical protein
MRTLVDPRLRDEAERFDLKWRCDDCAHFRDGACAHGYPTEPHRKTLEEPFIVFCKEFEM